MRAFVGPSILLSVARQHLIPNRCIGIITVANCNMSHEAGSNGGGSIWTKVLGVPFDKCKVVDIRAAIKKRGYTPPTRNKRTKAALLVELSGLVRAESFAPPDVTTSSSVVDSDNPERWNPDAGWADATTMERGQDGRILCRFCKTETSNNRRTFCCNGCVHEHRIRSQGSYVRKCLATRDGGICADCGLDAAELYRTARQAWRSGSNPTVRRNAVVLAMTGTPFEGKVPRVGSNRRPTSGMFWHADHIVPVVRGGGQCGLSNYQTLCVPCHTVATKRLAGERASARRKRGVVVDDTKGNSLGKERAQDGASGSSVFDVRGLGGSASDESMSEEEYDGDHDDQGDVASLKGTNHSNGGQALKSDKSVVGHRSEQQQNRRGGDSKKGVDLLVVDMESSDHERDVVGLPVTVDYGEQSSRKRSRRGSNKEIRVRNEGGTGGEIERDSRQRRNRGTAVEPLNLAKTLLEQEQETEGRVQALAAVQDRVVVVVDTDDRDNGDSMT